MRKFNLVIIGVLMVMSIPLSSHGGTKTDSSNEEAVKQETADVNPAMRNLKKQVEQLNLTLPVDMQGNLNMTTATIENYYLSFTCEYPENMDFTAPQDDATKISIVNGLSPCYTQNA